MFSRIPKVDVRAAGSSAARLKCWTGVSGEEDLPQEFDGQRPLPHESVVKALQRVLRAHSSTEVVPQFVNLQLPQGVVEVGGIVGSAPSLLISVRRLLKGLVGKALRPVLDRHSAGVQPDPHDEAAIAKQSRRELREMDHRVSAAKALLDHHLLAVVGPALRVAARTQELACLSGELLRVDE